jgi:hypothetical protein
MMQNERGAVIPSWSGLNPRTLYGVPPAASVGRPGDALDGPPLAASAGPAVDERHSDKPWHPDSPLFWFGTLLAVTLGLIGASTSIRVGPFKAAIAAGKK